MEDDFTNTNELEGVCFGDSRVNERSTILLESLFQGIGTGLNISCGGKAEIKAAYRFFDNEKVDYKKILKPHYQKTIERIKQHKIVGFSQDTTDIDKKNMQNVKNLGVLNDTQRPGCSLHPVIAFTPEKLCLGVVSTEFLIRPADELGKKTHNNLRKIEEKESLRWITGFKETCKIAESCPETLCVSIGDRESDIYELALEGVNPSNKAKLIIRAWHDRRLNVPSELHESMISENVGLLEINKILLSANAKLIKNKNIAKLNKDEKILFDNNKLEINKNKAVIKENKAFIKKEVANLHTFLVQMQKSEVIGEIEFRLPSGRGRKPRMVKQNVKACQVVLKPPTHKKNLPEVTINAVFLEEKNVPEGEDPVEWMFLTTMPINTVEEIELIIKLYISRWGIELFFKVLKSGCKIEELRFKEASRLLDCIAMYMIVSWRVLYTSYLGRTCPNISCSHLFEEDEWKSVFASVKRIKPPDNPPLLGAFMLMIAELGGYQGRIKQGAPGMIVIWRGLQKAYGLAEGWAMHREFG